MYETLIKMLDANNIIEDKIPQLIEIFVDYYGEEHREDIESKFNNLVIVTYQNPKNMQKNIKKIEEELKRKYMKKFNDIFCIKNSNDYKDKLLSVDKYYDFVNEYKKRNRKKTILGRINVYFEMREKGYSDYDFELLKEKAVEFLSNFYNNIDTNNIEKLYENRHFDIFDRYNDYYNILMKNYEKESRFLNRYKEYTERFSTLEKLLKNKYAIKYLNSISKYINDDEFFKFIEDEDRENHFNLDYYPDIKKIAGNPYDLSSDANLDNQISEKRKNYYKLYLMEYYKQMPDYIKTKEKIDAEDLVIDSSLIPEDYENRRNFYCLNLKKEKNWYKLFPVISIFLAFPNDIDCTIIHELNHYFETYLKKVDNKEVEYICGWEHFKEKIREKNESERNYELFNEIINELIAQEITKHMHDKGIFIFNNEDNLGNISKSSYKEVEFIVLDFFNKYKSDILKSRNNGNIQHIYNKIGKENFEQLNNLINKFSDFLCDNKINYDKLKKDLDDGIINDKTQFLKNILNKRDEILNNISKNVKKCKIK